MLVVCYVSPSLLRESKPLQISPQEVRVGFLLDFNADADAGFPAGLHALLQQVVGLLHLAKLELQFAHLVVQLVLHCLHIQKAVISLQHASKDKWAQKA